MFSPLANTPIMARERASVRRSREKGGGILSPALWNRVSFRVRLSRDFSWLPQMEGLLDG